MHTLSICLILVLGPFSITPTEAKTVVAVANAKAHEMGVDIKVKQVKTRKELPPLKWDVNNLGRQQLTMFWRYYQEIPKTRTCDRNHLLLPPMIVNDTRYLGGAAFRKFSVSNAVSKNAQGEDRLEQSGLAMIHELGHGMCLKHVDGPLNIMSPYFPSGVRSKDLPVSEESRRQLCLAK